jgi:hypothetical protein
MKKLGFGMGPLVAFVTNKNCNNCGFTITKTPPNSL